MSLDAEYETEDGSVGYEAEDTAPTPDVSAERAELKTIVAKAVSRLGEEYRTAVILRDINGLSYTEIAEVIGCSVGTVKSRISRGRANLKEILEKDFKIGGTYFQN
ncbi:MAG: sigma-70 family RNA polymerase sigma factor [Clostridia bacterium]|nr:sigma-70 family RNA polymerase sigma factor [Clostridia bacterium]